MEGIENIIAIGFGIIIALFIFLIAIYIVLGIVLNKLNKKIYGKGTALAWIPLCDIYLLGKLTVNKLFGFLLIALLFLNGSYTITNGQNESVYTIIPESFKGIYSLGYGILIVILFICAVVKLNKLGKGEETFINEVYLNQKTKQEIMEEDEQVNLIKWDETEPVSIEKKEINNIPFQDFFNESQVVETTKTDINEEINKTKEFNLPLENVINIETENSFEKPTYENKEKTDIKKDVLEVVNHADINDNTEELDIIDEENENLAFNSSTNEESKENNETTDDNSLNNVSSNIMEQSNEDLLKNNFDNIETPEEQHDDTDEEYDYDNPKIQEAIDNIIHKEVKEQNKDK